MLRLSQLTWYLITKSARLFTPNTAEYRLLAIGCPSSTETSGSRSVEASMSGTKSRTARSCALNHAKALSAPGPLRNGQYCRSTTGSTNRGRGERRGDGGSINVRGVIERGGPALEVGEATDGIPTGDGARGSPTDETFSNALDWLDGEFIWNADCSA